MSLLEYVKNLTCSDHVVVFSKTWCGCCKEVKEVFHDLEADFTAYELDKLKNGNAIQNALEDITGTRTVPRVFINGDCVGGAQEVRKLLEKGILEGMLHTCH